MFNKNQWLQPIYDTQGNLAGAMAPNGKKFSFSTSFGAPASSSKLVGRPSGQLPQYNGAQSIVPIVASLTPVSVNTTNSTEQTVTITGLLAGDIITNVVYTGGAQTSGITLIGWRLINAAAGTVGLIFKCSGGPLVPAAGNYTFTVARLVGATNAPHITLTGAGATTAAGTVTTLTGAVQNVALNSGKVRNRGRLTDWSTAGAGYAGLYGPYTATKVTSGNAGQFGSVMGIDFESDANKFELLINGSTSAAAYVGLRMIVDGKIVTPDVFPFPYNSRAYRLLVDFTQGGTVTPANTPRNFRIEISGTGGIQVGALTFSAADSVWAPVASSAIRAIMFGDSYTEGYLLPYQFTGFSNQLGYLMGWEDCWISGVGSTGYIRKTGGSTLTWRERITDITQNSPDVVVIMGSINDAIVSATAAQVQAEASLFYQQLTAALPNVPIFVAGTQITQPARALSSTLNQLALDMNNAIKAAIAPFPNCYWIEMNAASDLWITGSGTSVSPVGDGNADRFVLSDQTHPTQVGHDFLARRLEMSLRALMKGA